MCSKQQTITAVSPVETHTPTTTTTTEPTLLEALSDAHGRGALPIIQAPYEGALSSEQLALLPPAGSLLCCTLLSPASQLIAFTACGSVNSLPTQAKFRVLALDVTPYACRALIELGGAEPGPTPATPLRRWIPAEPISCQPDPGEEMAGKLGDLVPFVEGYLAAGAGDTAEGRELLLLLSELKRHQAKLHSVAASARSKRPREMEKFPALSGTANKRARVGLPAPTPLPTQAPDMSLPDTPPMPIAVVPARAGLSQHLFDVLVAPSPPLESTAALS
jgi:hypothetical protein